jgi:hypothetical protein
MTEGIQTLLVELARILQQINSTLFDFWPVALTVGIALCFFGFKLFRFSVFIFGFIIGATIGLGIGDLLIKPWGGIIGAIIAGLLGGYGFLFIIRVTGAIIGVVLGGILGVFFLGESVWVIPTAIISGLCGFFLLRFFIMASTSCWGALLAIGGLSRLLNLPIQENQDLLIISEAILFTVGLGYQIFSYKKKS